MYSTLTSMAPHQLKPSSKGMEGLPAVLPFLALAWDPSGPPGRFAVLRPDGCSVAAALLGPAPHCPCSATTFYVPGETSSSLHVLSVPMKMRACAARALLKARKCASGSAIQWERGLLMPSATGQSNRHASDFRNTPSNMRHRRVCSSHLARCLGIREAWRCRRLGGCLS